MNPEVITNARTLAHTLSDGSVKRALRQLADSLEETRELEAERDHWHANAMKAAAHVKWMRDRIRLASSAAAGAGHYFTAMSAEWDTIAAGPPKDPS